MYAIILQCLCVFFLYYIKAKLEILDLMNSSK